MNKLQKHKFAELYEMSSGISTKASQAGHGSPFVSFTTVFNNHFLPESFPDLMDTSESEQETYSVKEGDVFLTRTSETIDELGMSCVAAKDYPGATYSGFLKRLRPLRPDLIYAKYMAFYLRGNLFRKAMNNNAVMTLRCSLNEQIFSYLDLLLPSYKEQVSMGDFLYLIQEKIALNHRINTELEGMAKLLYDYWFVQYDFPLSAAQAAALGKPRLAGQPYRSSGGPMVFDPQLKREVPKGWKVNELQSFLTLAYGKALKKTDHQAGPYPVYGSGGIYGSHYEALVKGPGIIVGRKGTVGSIHWEDEDFYPTDTTYYVIPSQGYSLVYLSHLLKSLDLAAMNTDSAVPGLNRNNAYSRTVANPPTNLIEEFTKIVSPLRSMISANRGQNQELTTLRDWLLPMLMNGQVRVG